MWAWPSSGTCLPWPRAGLLSDATTRTTTAMKHVRIAGDSTPDHEYHAGMTERVVLVTGFEAFGPHGVNPSEALAKAVDGRRFGNRVTRSAVLPVHHAEARARVDALIADLAPRDIVHLGLANGRARIALERAALNVMDYPIADNAGRRVANEPCVPGGPAAYLSTLPLLSILAALLGEGIPAYISNTAGTFLCNQTLYE